MYLTPDATTNADPMHAGDLDDLHVAVGGGTDVHASYRGFELIHVFWSLAEHAGPDDCHVTRLHPAS